MQLRSKITVARNIRIYHHKAQNAVVLGLEVVDIMVKTTFKQLEKRFNSVYMASDFYLSTWTCGNTELQRVQVNSVNFACYSFLLGGLFSTCLDCFMIFLTDSP